jgi:hypothetical protein
MKKLIEFLLIAVDPLMCCVTLFHTLNACLRDSHHGLKVELNNLYFFFFFQF